MHTHTHIIKTALYSHYITPECFRPQRAILRDYGWYISAARSIKFVTRRKIQLSEQRAVCHYVAAHQAEFTSNIKFIRPKLYNSDVRRKVGKVSSTCPNSTYQYRTY